MKDNDQTTEKAVAPQKGKVAVHTVSEEGQTLKRGIAGWQVTFIALGGIIGSAYFLGIGLIVQEMGPSAIFAYAIVGFILFGIMTAFAELLVNLPRKGTFISYAQEFLGDSVASGIGWSYWLAWGAYIPSEAIAGGIVLDKLIPGNVFLYACIILVLVSVINLAEVKFFARVESVNAVLKLGAIVVFIIAALGIWFGVFGNNTEFIGTSIILPDPSLSVYEQLFPYGAIAVFVFMTMVFSSVGGVEIVGMTAAEAQNPEKAIPKACRSIVYRVVIVYIIPLILICLLLPTAEAGIDGSIYATILNKYGLNSLAGVFSVIIFVAAFSCSNACFYATVRDMYALSQAGLAPRFLSKLNKNHTPKNAVYVSLAFVWIVLLVASFAGESSAYAYLFVATGFAGSICWVGILSSMLIFRLKLKKRGYVPSEVLKSRVKYLPITIISLILLLTGLGYLIAELENVSLFLIAISAFVIPMLIRYISKKMKHERAPLIISSDEKTFDEAFPEK
jgi:AAT family amino acid transporter